jgi:hypothetical protein
MQTIVQRSGSRIEMLTSNNGMLKGGWYPKKPSGVADTARECEESSLLEV